MKQLFRIIVLLGCTFVVSFILFLIVISDRRPRIYFAAEKGDTNAIAQHLASGSNVNDLILCEPSGGKNRHAPLLDIAVSGGELTAVDFLLQKGANPNQKDSQGDTPLLWAIAYVGNNVTSETQERILETLLKAGADPNLASSSGIWTPLIQAALLSEPASVKALLAFGADVNRRNNEGCAPLHCAGNAEVARLLIAAGADPTARTDGPSGETPAQSAIRLGHFSTLEVLTNLRIYTNR